MRKRHPLVPKIKIPRAPKVFRGRRTAHGPARIPKRSHMDKQAFSSGRAAIAWLMQGGDTKTPETASAPATKAAVKRAARAITPDKAPKPTMTAAQYIAQLPPALVMRGDGGTASVDDVIKRIRSELDGAVKAGVFPSGTKINTRKGSGSSSIRSEVSVWPGQVLSNEYTEHVMDPSIKWDPDFQRWKKHSDPRLSAELNKALETIEKIAERHNYNKSDSMTDHFNYGYSYDADADPVIDTAKNGIKLEIDAAFRELVAKTTAAAKAVGPACTKSVLGTARIESAYPSNMEQLIRIAERAKGQPVEYDGSRRGWFPKADIKDHETIKLGKSEYIVVSKSASGYSLMGARGGSSSLTRAGNNPDSWGHISHGSPNNITWYRKAADGTFHRL